MKKQKEKGNTVKDEDIVKLYLSRSEAAIAETDNKYGNYLKRLVVNILRNQDDTEEILNDTYMGVWRAIPPTVPENLKYFCARIARNLSMDRLDYLLAGKRRAVFVEMDEAVPDTAQTPEEAWELKEIGMALNEFLDTLDRKTCALFVARYYYCYSIPELEKRYGLSQRQVKYKLEKTRKKLQVFLQEEGVIV